jgi:hypothetical protein
MDETNDLNLREIHRALADLFQGVIDQYEILLGQLRSNDEFGGDKELSRHG